MPYSLTLPNGFVVNGIPDDVPRSQALDNIRQKMPDAFPAPPGIVQQLIGAPGEIIKGFTRGITVDPLSGIASLGYTGARAAGAELAPFEQTALGRGLSQAQTYLAPKDEGAITQVAGGIGSLASFIPGALLKGGIKAATLGAQAMGLGSEEARARTEQARLEGKDVSAQQQLLAQTGGAGVGLTELAPVERLAGPLRALFRGIKPDDAARIAPGLANSVQRMAITGGIEGVQEGTATILQDLIQRGVYDPNLPIGQSALGDAALGATVGTIAQGALELATRGRRTQAYEQLKEQERQRQAAADAEKARLEQERQFAETRRNLGVETPLLGLPAPAPKIETEERVDPLMNPVGFVKSEELSPEHLKYINDVRKKEGKKPLNQFSVEDLADAGAPQQELDRILTFKTGYDGRTQLSAQDVLNIAAERNVDTSTSGFTDFLRRATGAEDLNNMSQPQLFSAFKAIDSLDRGQATQILPPGTNATRFSEDQYNKAMTGLAAEIPKNNMMSRDQAIEAIKQYTGLETDRDAESLLQTAIRSGDYTTVNRTVYELGIPGDPTSPPVRRYTTREAAENAAQRLGLEVRERTHQDVALPGKATQLPGGPDIREGSFKQSVAPAGFEIRSPDAVLQTATTQEEADAKADRLQQLRAQKANGYLGEIAKKNELMQKSQRKLESMEADGKTNTLEYKKMAAGVAAQNKRLQNEIDALKAKVQSYTAPLEIAPKGQKPVARTGFTLFEQNQPVATFPSQQAAEEAAISRLPDETLQNIVKLAPSQKGLMPKRLGKMAEAELRRRRGEEPAGFGVEITGTRAEAEARLAAAGVFTPEFQKAAAELEKKLRPLMDRLGLKDLRLNIMRTIKTKDGQSADGYYLQRLIAIAMDADNPMRTLRHEGIHALKELGAFTPQQWQVLEDRARSEWMGKYDIANRYKGMGLTQDEMLEEAISDAFSDFDQTKAPPGLIGALFNKIKQFMQAFGNAMNGLGFQTAEDVFTAVEAGGLKPIAAEGAADRIRPSGEDETEKPKYQLSASERETLEQGSFADQTYLRNYDIWQQSFNALPKDIKNKLDAYYVASRKAAVTAQDPGYWDRGARSASTRTFKVASDALEQHFGRQLSTDELAIFLNDWVGSLNERLGKDQTFDRIKYARKSKKFEQTSDLTPLTVEKAKFQEQELEALIKKIGDRIVGMKSGETLDNVRQAVEKLQSYTAQGLRGRKWYEQSAKAVLDAFNGDPVLAEKFFQIIAITSANTEVAANFTKTTKAWTQFAQGKPIKVGTENENKKIEALLNFGEDWDGRKTNTFYTNLMEAMDGKDSGRSTIDLHMTRMLFDKDAPTDAQYELAENMVRLLASKLNVPARQVQAASWVTQKAKTIFEEYRKKGWKKDLNDLELRQFAFERAAADYSHLMKAKVSALPVTDAMKELSSSIRNRVQTITGEVIPSVQSEMSQVEAIEFDAKDKLTKSIAKQNFIPNIAEALNLTSKVRVTVGSGAYQSKVNPNLIVQLVNPDPDVLKKEALDLANAMSYVFKQDATPFFRADPALVDTGQLGFRFRFDTKTLTPAQQKKILALLNGKFGADAGFTRVRGNEIVLINFRGDDGQPFLTSDAEFVNGLAELRPQIENIAKLEAQEVFGAESEYPYHDWKSDPVGTGIVQGIYSRGPQRPDLQRRLDSIRESFTERARDAVAETGRDPKFSLRPTEPVVRPSTEGDGISIGERQPGAMTFDGVHYSNTADVPVLFGRRYGSGIRGAEAKRLQYADPRIKNRVYFYIPRENGVMPIPEAGLGGHVYIQRLNNMLGPGPEMSRIMREAMGDSNNFESGVVDAGYDGYAVPSMGMMVVLNNDVPVQYRGTRDQIRQKPDEEKVQIGDRRYALRQTDTPEFKKWFGDSKVVNADGKPLVVYTGTSKDVDFTKFKVPKSGAWFTSDRNVASQYALENDSMDIKTKDYRTFTEVNKASRVMPVFLNISNPYSLTDEDLKSLRYASNYKKEQGKIFEQAKSQGYDGIDFGDGTWVVIKSPNQIKSAIGNIGTFARDNNDIRYALALKNLDPDSPIVPTEGGNPDGSMGLMPERLNGKPIRMLIGMHNDLIPERDNEKLSKPVSFGANHILNRVLNDPKRMPAGAEELLEKIARTAQRTAQNYNAIYKDGSKFILYDGKNSLIVSPGADEMSIVTMYTQENPNRRYGNPVWVGRAPKVAQFLQPLRGTEVIAAGERVGRKPIPVQTKRVYTPSTVETGEAPVAREPRGKLTLKKPQYSLRQPVDIESAQSIPQGAFDVEPTATRDNLIYLLQDKQIDLKRVIEGIRQTGRDISDRWNAYLKEELFHGRSAARVKQFTDVELQPLLRKMDSAQVSLDEMDQYLLARHAKEANDYIRSINPDPAANAGMTDQEADDYMKSLPAPRKAALERLAKEVDDITKKTRDLMVDYGLEKPETIDTWEKTYKHYVPLFREETEGSPISIGRGYNIRGRTVGQRMGSSKKVVDVLSNIAMQRERTIVRGEKNRVGNALYGLVLQNPNKGFWAVINPEKTNKAVLTRELIDLGIDPDMVENLVSRPTRKVIDKKTGLVTQQVSPMWKNAGNIFITRINGEDRIIGFNLNDERAMRMVSTLKNLDAQQQGEAIRMMGTAGDYYRKTIEGVGKGTRFFASVNTQYNPAFGIYNLMRDIGGAALNLQNTPLKGNERKVIADAFTAIKAVYRDLRRKRNGLDADSKWAEIFEDFELQGGKTGYRDMFENAEDRAQQLQKDIQNFGQGGPKKAGRALLDWLSDFNDAIENAVRVSVYKNAMDQGISKERAASLAKNITVNFNRTGAVSRNFQTLFAFFNASVQGTARIAQTLLTSDGKLSTIGKRIVMGGLSLGVIQAVLLAMAGLDEDEVPDFIKDKSFVIPTGDGKYLAIPMPLGYNIIPGFGRRVMEFAMSDDKNIGKAIVNTAQMIIDGFNPLGSATFVQTLTPTVLDPIVALAENKDFTGKPIAREDINSMSPTPGYTRGSQNSFAVTQGLAYAINLLSGGSEFKKGVISPTPDQIEYLVGQVFGGVGREAMKIARGVEAAATGEELATYNIPIAGRMIGNVQQKAAQTTRFYENIKRLNEHQAEIEGRMLKGEDISEYINQNPEASMYQVGDKIYSKISKLRQVKKALQESGAERDSIRVIDDAMLNLMTSLNQLYGEARQ